MHATMHTTEASRLPSPGELQGRHLEERDAACSREWTSSFTSPAATHSPVSIRVSPVSTDVWLNPEYT